MKSVKVLGPGCRKCKALEDKVRSIVASNNIDADVEKISELDEIMKYGIMLTPGLVINEKVKSYGVIPKEEQILTWLNEE
jgi:small redox-active disulfide protein 2